MKDGLILHDPHDLSDDLDVISKLFALIDRHAPDLLAAILPIGHLQDRHILTAVLNDLVARPPVKPLGAEDLVEDRLGGRPLGRRFSYWDVLWRSPRAHLRKSVPAQHQAIGDWPLLERPVGHSKGGSTYNELPHEGIDPTEVTKFVLGLPAEEGFGGLGAPQGGNFSGQRG